MYNIVSYVLDCANGQKQNKLQLIAPFATALSLSILLGVCIIPLLVYHLKGARRIYTMAQQICIILNSILFGVTQFTLKTTTFMEKASGRIFHSAIILNIIFTSLGSFLYYHFYFLSLMQSIDIYILVCWSFHYKKFSSTIAGLKMVALGAGLCLLIISDELAILVRVTVSNLFDKHLPVFQNALVLKSWKGFVRIARIFSLVKLCLIKISFAIAILRIALSVRKQLISSMALAANVCRKRRYTSLLIFVCVPLLIDIVFIGYDLTLFLDFAYGYSEQDKCRNAHSAESMDSAAIRTLVFMVNSFIQSISYLVLFPKIRKSFWCKTE